MSYRDQPRSLDSIGKRLGKPLLALALLFTAPFSAMASGTCGPAELSEGTIRSVSPGGDIALEDGRLLRLAGLHLPAQADVMSLRPGQPVAYGLLSDVNDRWLRYPAMVFLLKPGADPVWLQQRLIEDGKALIRPEATLGACWPLLKAAEAAARRQQPISAEAGRFVRIEGRVGRVGEGRSAWFVNVFARENQRVTGVVQKRHLRRLKDGGVDVNALQGQTVRLRGVRGIRNTGVIQVTQADQIEIVR